jgi:hypothetical protein
MRLGRIYDRRRKLREGRLEESALEGSLSRPGCCNGSWRGARMSGALPATDCDRLWGLKHTGVVDNGARSRERARTEHTLAPVPSST